MTNLSQQEQSFPSFFQQVKLLACNRDFVGLSGQTDTWCHTEARIGYKYTSVYGGDVTN